MKVIVLIARFGSCMYNEVMTIILTKGEEKQIENGVIDKSDLIEESLDLGSGDSWFEIEPTKESIKTFTELVEILKKNKR